MYSSSSEKNLKSIKSRMGWQVALQAGTLLSIGSLNSTVKKQTDLITSELTQIQDINIDGFASIEDALNSLESSLIAGFEDLKWFLGSIDDKLAKLIGLVEFPKSTESTEQYLFGLELFKQEYYKKSITSFSSAIDKNPLNLNAKVGLYLAKKASDKKEDLKLLDEIIKLTDSNFTLNLDISEESKNKSIIFFSNFVFNELSRLEKYDLILNYFENDIVDIAKKELNIRIRYISSKINKKKDYENDLRIIIEDGDLLNLLCFIEYKEDKKFVNFLINCSKILNETFSKYSKLEFSEDDELCIRRSAALIIKNLKDDSELIKLASTKNTLAYKDSFLNNFFEKAEESINLFKSEKLKLITSETSIKKIKENKKPIFEKEENEFLKDSHKIIQNQINNLLKEFKTENLKELESSIEKSNNKIDEFKKHYPAIEEEEQESYDSITTFINSIDIKNQKINYKSAFQQLAENQETRKEIEDSQKSIRKSINDTVNKVGKTEAIKLFAKIKKKGGGTYGKKWAKEMVEKYT
ncbi:hypothetical protein HOK76_00035 [archaeon]|nr:hypothetical protein [archaeon]MBT5422864.1 hypothetical protein [archaeon]